MRFGIVLDSAFEGHSPPGGHPESPRRVVAIGQRLRAWRRFEELVQVAPAMAGEGWVLGVHSQDHYRQVERTEGRRSFHFDADTWAGPDSFQTALLAAGSVVALIRQLDEDNIDSGLAVVRPPGHHAETRRAMGFCLFNNVAVGAHWAVSQGAAERVAIVDFDVHHGNGTQEIFYSRPDVLYISTHQYPFYPGTGHFREVGEGEGTGHTINIPFSAGAGDEEYDLAFRDLVCPILARFRPGLILVSAGYDAHRDDPLAGMDLTTAGFARLVNRLNRTALEICQGRILYVLEGGYNLVTLAEGVEATIRTALEPEAGETASRTGDYGQELRRFFSSYWDI